MRFSDFHKSLQRNQQFSTVEGSIKRYNDKKNYKGQNTRKKLKLKLKHENFPVTP